MKKRRKQGSESMCQLVKTERANCDWGYNLESYSIEEGLVKVYTRKLDKTYDVG
jgi:hypothetical protein